MHLRVNVVILSRKNWGRGTWGNIVADFHRKTITYLLAFRWSYLSLSTLHHSSSLQRKLASLENAILFDASSKDKTLSFPKRKNKSLNMYDY